MGRYCKSKGCLHNKKEHIPFFQKIKQQLWYYIISGGIPFRL